MRHLFQNVELNQHLLTVFLKGKRPPDFVMESIVSNVTSILHLNTTAWKDTEETTEDTFMDEVETYSTFKLASFIDT